ncbi:ABC transporter permease [Formosa sediminum]|uniref:Transport permease protein n=1 Tax=Formosa sediminum TaxID=2594004 RepID=A0A516GQ67_9FLAO|nr:ABC transporter permease [Formosa sediminum]QDO93675.1 ABC transporter permease [Formosa sediminum]
MNSKIEHQKITIYEAQAALSFKKLFKEIVADITPAKALGLQLAKRDIKAAYRQSVLGIVWAFIPPIMTSLIWIILNSSNTVSIKNTPIPYPAFVLIGTLLWQTLTDSINQPLRSVNTGKSILAKLNFPRESLLFHGMFTLFFNTSLKLLIIFAVLIVFKINPGLQGLAILPMILGIMITGFTIGLLLMPVGMMYGDISRMIPFSMQFLMYLTPVIYPMPTSGKLVFFNKINPFTYLIETARNLLSAQPVSNLGLTFSILAIAFIVLCLGVIVYRFIMPIIIERVGS